MIFYVAKRIDHKNIRKYRENKKGENIVTDTKRWD